MRHILLISVVFFTACAQVVAPSGGDKDKTPPVLLSSTPANFTTNFNALEVRFQFDEYVTINKINSALVVSPPLLEQPEMRMKGKSVIMTMPDSMASNTTYVFNFGEGITDLNEGNVFNLVHVFSTGSQIDSLEINGLVIDAFTKKPVENASILLYENYVDSLPKTTRPNFFARTNKKGEFTVPYLKANQYGLVALVDGNADLIFNTPTEGIAFLDTSIIHLTEDTLPTLQPLYTFVEDKTPLKITDKKRIKSTEYRFGFNKKIENVSVRALEDSIGVLYTKTSEKQDSLFVWTTHEPKDSVKFEISLNEIPTDTVIFYIRKSNKVKLATKIQTISPISTIGKHQNYTLAFNQPIQVGDISKLSLISDSTLVESKWSITDSNVFELIGEANWLANNDYQLVLDSGAVLSRNGVSMDSTSMKFSVKPPDYFGVLYLNITFEKKASYVLTLLSGNGVLISKQLLTEDKKLVFPNLKPGKYTCHIFEDENGDAEWTTGDFDIKRQPEKIFYLNKELKIRSNWDLKIDWEVSAE
ncbi:MAG: hypothetical protein ACJAUV_000588 [Flavobacteriales bacterium]|jgi:hypothetical protein